MNESILTEIEPYMYFSLLIVFVSTSTVSFKAIFRFPTIPFICEQMNVVDMKSVVFKWKHQSAVLALLLIIREWVEGFL